MSSIGNVLEVRVVRRLSGICRNCREPAADDSDFCPRHDVLEKGYKARSAKRRRSLRRDGGLCIDCGGRSRAPRCKACRRIQRDRARDRRRVEGSGRRVEGGAAISRRGHIKLDTADRRVGRTAVERYVGRDHRGAPSRAELNADILKDVRDARGLIEQFARRFEIAEIQGVWDMGKVQREAALRIVAEHGARAVRILSAVVLGLDPTADLEVIPEGK